MKNLNGLRKLGGASISKVIPGDRGYDNISQVQFFCRFKNMLRFVLIHRNRNPLLNGTEDTPSGADISQNQESCRFSGKTFSGIGTLGTLANGVQVQPIQETFHGMNDFRVWNFLFEPVGKPFFHP
jgi:hypothetical protein